MWMGSSIQNNCLTYCAKYILSDKNFDSSKVYAVVSWYIFVFWTDFWNITLSTDKVLGILSFEGEKIHRTLYLLPV